MTPGTTLGIDLITRLRVVATVRLLRSRAAAFGFPIVVAQQLDDMRAQFSDLRQDRDHWRKAFQATLHSHARGPPGNRIHPLAPPRPEEWSPSKTSHAPRHLAMVELLGGPRQTTCALCRKLRRFSAAVKQHLSTLLPCSNRTLTFTGETLANRQPSASNKATLCTRNNTNPQIE